MLLLVGLFTFQLLLATGGTGEVFRVDQEDKHLLVPQLIRKYGYPLEEYQVHTEDGYLLSVHRIPGRAPTGQDRRKYPVLMVHSLFSTSADWILIGPRHGLAYLLADRGYDIWMGNARGNRYSRQHERLRVEQPAFWNFTFHEIGFYDVPAMIDYVLEQTNSKKLHYIGFSQGTLVGFVALSYRPEYNEKIVQLQALSPAVFVNRNPSTIITILANLAEEISERYTSSNKFHFAGHADGEAKFVQRLCLPPTQILCRLLIHDVAGANPRNLDSKMLQIFLGHFPAGSSLKQVQHYAQMIQDGLFRQYDYGDPKLNGRFYGSSAVPEYNLSRVTASVRTYFGYNDNTINYRNVKRLEQMLPNLAGSYPVPDQLFTHFDFILGNNVREVLYEEVLQRVMDAENGLI
ncbi:lipase 1-like [Sabethes cyaneus]|uniref:lipase 1-like n=1 Tax=Sabethes cyaneus TaxID=53552 RepID=UPI00237E80E7|nr:lipase 1-like [Sabethes cyaneus]